MKNRVGIWKKHTTKDMINFLTAYAEHLKHETNRINLNIFDKNIDDALKLNDPMDVRLKLMEIGKNINKIYNSYE